MPREISEHDATVAVDAAARKLYADYQLVAEFTSGGWDDLPANVQLELRQQVLPTVWAALGALPDPRHAAWLEGYVAGQSDASFECEGSGTPPTTYPHNNPYPAEEA